MKKLFQMKILKLLNKKNLSIITIYLLSSISLIAEDKPIDIWNIEKKEVEVATEEILLLEKLLFHQQDPKR